MKEALDIEKQIKDQISESDRKLEENINQNEILQKSNSYLKKQNKKVIIQNTKLRNEFKILKEKFKEYISMTENQSQGHTT